MEAQAPDVDAMRSALGAQAPPGNEYRGPAFFFPETLPSAGRAELLGDLEDAPESGPFAWLREAREESHPIAIVRAADGELAAVCHSARLSSGAAEAGVETAPEHRRRGYGAEAVTAWAAAVREGGRRPLYSTWWGNTASRALARRLGLTCYGEDTQIG
jgi:RimJ/RimL family protein N-acetyltransferase